VIDMNYRTAFNQASRRRADDYSQPEFNYDIDSEDLTKDQIKWFELEPGYDFDTEDIDGERAVRAWSPDVDVDAFSLGTVYQLDDGTFQAVGNDEFTRLKTLGYFDNIEEAKQAVINSMETDGWLPEFKDVANKPSKHTGTLPTRKAINMNYRTAKWNPDDYLPDDDRYGYHHSKDEKFGLAVLSAFEDAYGNEYTYTDGGQGDDYGEVEGVYEHNGQPHLFIELTINHYKCRISYASDDVNVEEEADLIRLNSDPTKSAEMIHDTIENYIDEVYLNPDDYHYGDEF